MKKFIICLILVLICSVSFAANGPTEKITVGSGNISDGSITTAKLADSSVTNSKVATGTFAEQNGQATEDFVTKDLQVFGKVTKFLDVSVSTGSGIRTKTTGGNNQYGLYGSSGIAYGMCGYTDGSGNIYSFYGNGNCQFAGTLHVGGTPTYADNAAAGVGGLVAGDVYRTATGQLMVRY